MGRESTPLAKIFKGTAWLLTLFRVISLTDVVKHTFLVFAEVRVVRDEHQGGTETGQSGEVPVAQELGEEHLRTVVVDGMVVVAATLGSGLRSDARIQNSVVLPKNDGGRMNRELMGRRL